MATDVDIILKQPQEPEYCLMASPEDSVEFAKIIKSAFIDPNLDFFLIHSNFDEEYTKFLDAIYSSQRPKPGTLIRDVFYSTELFLATKQLIWILFYSFLQLSDKTLNLQEQYNQIFDKLSLNFYSFRQLLLEDVSIPSKRFNNNWSILTLCVWFSIISKEFPKSLFQNNLQFFKQSENIVQKLLIGFISEASEMHDEIKHFFDDQSFFEKEEEKLSLSQKELKYEMQKKQLINEKLLNRNRILFNSSDNSILLTRAFELKGIQKSQNIRKNEFRNKGQTIIYHRFGDNQKLEIKTDASKERVQNLKQNHTKTVHQMMRNICYEEAKFENYIASEQEKLNEILKNKEDTKLRAAKLVQSHMKHKK